LLRSLLVLDPNKRFSASQCLSHPYFERLPKPTPKGRLILVAPSS
jgi:serine/threonine protein kinase